MILYSIGKDSSALLHLAMKAFYPAILCGIDKRDQAFLTAAKMAMTLSPGGRPLLQDGPVALNADGNSPTRGASSSTPLFPMTDNTTVLVTGSDGFIGRHLVPYLCTHGFKVIGASRSATAGGRNTGAAAALPDLSTSFDWSPLLSRCDAVVHLAAVAHRPASDDLLDQVNHRATGALAKATARLDKHLVFVSSIAAQSGSFADHELTEDDAPQPLNAYGRSKLAAEEAIRDAGGSFTILRPVVIYGDGEKGNLATIRKIARLPIPLPFGGLTAPRSVLSVGNLSSAVVTALTDTRARQHTFIVSDPTPVTVADLITHYRGIFGRPAWLFPMPQWSLELMLRTVGQTRTWQRIGCPLVARPKKLMTLGWKPVDLCRSLTCRHGDTAA